MEIKTELPIFKIRKHSLRMLSSILSFKNSKVKELYVVKNGYHEMYLDKEREEFFEKILIWITENKSIGKTDRRKNYFKNSFSN